MPTYCCMWQKTSRRKQAAASGSLALNNDSDLSLSKKPLPCWHGRLNLSCNLYTNKCKHSWLTTVTHQPHTQEWVRSVQLKSKGGCTTVHIGEILYMYISLVPRPKEVEEEKVPGFSRLCMHVIISYLSTGMHGRARKEHFHCYSFIADICCLLRA